MSILFLMCVLWFTDELYRCSKCGDQFLYPNCLRAHLRFRCRYRKQHPKTTDVVARRQSSPRTTSGDISTSGDVTKSHHVTKRKAEEEDDGEVVPAMKRRSSPAEVLPRDGKVAQGLPTSDAGGELNGFVGVGVPRLSCRSAFQLVDKAQLGPRTPPSPSQAISSSSPSDVAILASPLPLSVVTSAVLTPLNAMSTTRAHAVTTTSGLFMFPAAERLHAPMLLNAGFVGPNSPIPTTYPRIGDELPHARNFFANNNNDVTGSDVKLVNQSPLSIAVHKSRQSRPPPPPLPPSLHNEYRPSNPMVEKLLQLVSSSRPVQASSSRSAVGGAAALSASFPSMQLAQNWCAKCNTSFRMTSDLVYHMRTQHKHDLDPANQSRRKDDNKLRCDVCGETFKERHHLTRHMTSHT